MGLSTSLLQSLSPSLANMSKQLIVLCASAVALTSALALRNVEEQDPLQGYFSTLMEIFDKLQLLGHDVVCGATTTELSSSLSPPSSLSSAASPSSLSSAGSSSLSAPVGSSSLSGSGAGALCPFVFAFFIGLSPDL